MPSEEVLHESAGLCASCAHARRIESARGSTFVLCELFASDQSFPKYPRLPVVRCDGYEPRDAQSKISNPS